MMNLSIIISFIFFCVVLSREVVEFGIYTNSISWAGTTASVTLNLWFQYEFISCTIKPTTPNAKYSCRSNEWTKMNRECDAPSYSMLIENDYVDAVGVDKLYVVMDDGIHYGADKFCVINANLVAQSKGHIDDYDSNCPVSNNGVYLDYLCIDNQVGDCAPEKIMIDFDIAAPNQYITNALWMDATDIIVPPQLCPTTLPPTLRPTMDILDNSDLCKWTLIYKNDADGNNIYGNINTLIEDIKSGKDIKIYAYSTYNEQTIQPENIAIFENNVVVAYAGEVYQAKFRERLTEVSLGQWQYQLEKWALSTTGALNRFEFIRDTVHNEKISLDWYSRC